MAGDIFDFWAGVSDDAREHPADSPILARSDHGFDLRCLPSNIDGPLRTARVVLLYLSPGVDDRDLADVTDPAAPKHYAAMRTGTAPLRGPEGRERGHAWLMSRVKRFGTWPDVRDKLAILNIGAYHSKTFKDYHMLAALPSSRASLDWAHNVLFPEAERGDRVVICLRSAAYWGLGKRGRYGKGLFAPAVNMGGHMTAAGVEMATRDDVVEAARKALAG